MPSREQEQDFNFGELTVLLRRWSSGDREALDLLVPMIYAELKRIASLHMRREHNPGTLQASALVNEAYVRLAGGPVVDFTTRAHFFALASRVMRQILVDRARTRNRVKRGGGAAPVQLTEISAAIEAPSTEILDLDDALVRLAALDDRKARVVEMRFFGGMEVSEVANVLGISENTVMRDWTFARAWLKEQLS